MSRRSFEAAYVVVATVLILGLLPGSALAGANQAVLLKLEGKPLATGGELMAGTTFVPVKALSAELGFKTSSRQAGQITVTYGDKKVAFTLGTNQVLANGHETWCVSHTENDSLMVPVRFFLENMGFRVVWSSDPAATVDIYPVQENNVVIGTVRERQETAALSLDVQYPKLSGLQSTAVQDAANAFFARRVEGPIAQGYQSVKDLAKAKASNPDMPSWPTDVILNYTIEYNQNGLLSVLFQDYLFRGGAHGMTYRSGYLINLGTGKTYASLKDLFKDGTDYIPLLSTEVKKGFDASGIPLLTPFVKLRPDQGFYINDDDLVIYTDLYEYTPYVAGFPEFRIPLASLSSVLVPELAVAAQH